MVDVYVGLGSNIRPEHNLARACDELGRRYGPLRASSVYRSPPVGFDGDDFLNMVVAFGSDAGPDAIESVLTAIEQAAGRRRLAGVSGPRTLDLDLLLYGARVDPGRRLPRADVFGYDFVLGPLAQIAPDLHHPVSGVTIGRQWCRRAAAVVTLIDVGPVEGLTSQRCGRRRPRRSGR